MSSSIAKALRCPFVELHAEQVRNVLEHDRAITVLQVDVLGSILAFDSCWTPFTDGFPA